MKPELSPNPNPIPIPLDQRWRQARLGLLPLLVFVVAVGSIAWLWRDHVAAPTLVGQAEPVLSNVSSYKPGFLAELSVTRFQRVKAGDLLGRVQVAEPQMLTASLAVIQAETETLRTSLSPVAEQQRNAINYTQLQLEWMKERAALAEAQVNGQLADIELKRARELFQSRIGSQEELDRAEAGARGWQQQVEQLTRLVAEVSRHVTSFQLTNCDLATVSERPLAAAIALQEAKLRQVEAELSPVLLKAPIDGIITSVFYRTGEAVTAGQPIVAIATLSPVRIVGYLRSPLTCDPRAGMRVEVRTRSGRREAGRAQIREVGSQFEPIPEPLLGPVKLANIELGLPVDISLPPTLALRPGELVDITLDTKVD